MGVCVVAAVAACLCAPLEPGAAEKPGRVDKLFAAMRKGTFRQEGLRPPRLEWSDVPALLKRAESVRPLKCFPRNPLSSYIQFRCPEGIVALWLIECLRQGPEPRFPSLNAFIIRPADNNGQPLGAISEGNHKAALQAYRAWWKKVGKLPPQKARAVDPLANTGLRWR